MTQPIKQHLIDPELCIRCYTCEETCPIEAITHDDNNVVVDGSKCNYCMDCIAPCPTGSIDNWRVVSEHYSLKAQFSWDELPEQQALQADLAGAETTIEAFDDQVAALIAEAHQGAGGHMKAPASASKPTVNLFRQGQPVEAVVQGNFRLTANDSDADVRHIILDLGRQTLPVLEGQSLGVLAPGTDDGGKPHLPRLYSVSSPRDGERPNTNNLSLTVKREDKGICSNYLCDLAKGNKVQLIGPFGATFLLPNDPDSHLIMICTGTGSAPFRGFTMRRQRVMPNHPGTMSLYFGARSPQSLPYFGPLAKVPDAFLAKHFAFSRVIGRTKTYVQDKLRENGEEIGRRISKPTTYIYVCGLKAMEAGVETALSEIADSKGLNWPTLRDRMRDVGRYHVETY